MVFSFVGVSRVEAARMNDIEGTYTISMKSSISVAKVGRSQSMSTGECSISASSETDGTYTLLHTTDILGVYSPIPLAIIPGGKKVAFQLSGAAMVELDNLLKNWLASLAPSDTEVIALSLEYPPPVCTPAAIAAKTIQRKPVKVQAFMPKQAKLTIKGLAHATIRDNVGTEDITAKFTYTTQIKFVGKQ
jgi:hypothetical protein